MNDSYALNLRIFNDIENNNEKRKTVARQTKNKKEN